MISLAGRDILHAWGKFVFTGIGLGLLIGVTLTMAGVYRGMVDDGKVLLDNSGADLWVVQKDTLGPYAESSSVPDDLWRGIRAMPGVAQAANITFKLIGTRNRTIAWMILQQALVLGVIGFVVGKITATFAAPLFPKYVLLVPFDTVAGFIAVLAICVLSSVVAIRMALRVDPAEAIG